MTMNGKNMTIIIMKEKNDNNEGEKTMTMKEKNNEDEGEEQ